MVWEDAEKRNDPETRPGRLFRAIRNMVEIRSKYEVFHSGADVWTLEPYNDHILGIGRYCRGEKLLALFNFSDYDETAWINEEGNWTDLITGETKEAKAVGIPSKDFVWLWMKF